MKGSQSHDIFSNLSSIQSSGFGILDGGFATHLEDTLKQDISSSPLWSASLLQTEKGCSSIIQTHLDFLKAGSQIISTSTYQASPLSFKKAGLDERTSENLLIKSVELAESARKQYIEQQQQQQQHHDSIERPLISLSLGPFGASQSDGSEYTGIYKKPFDEQETPITIDEMIKFHYDRLYILAKDSEVWKTIDLLAFETIPRIDEAESIREALKKLYSSLQCQKKFTYISFVFPNGTSLPFPVQDGNDQEHMNDIIKSTLVDDEDEDEPLIEGIGINCTKPYYLSKLVHSFTLAVKEVQKYEKRTPYLFLYPDGGLIWDGIAREWKSDNKMGKGNETSALTSVWAEKVMEAAKEFNYDQDGNASNSDEQKRERSPWSGCFIGGCCKSTTNDIQSLRKQVR